MPPTEGATPFESTEVYYAEHRPGYGDRAIEYLCERFTVGETARVLDLGCGAGQIAVPIARVAGEVVGMDPNVAMLAEARKRAHAAGVENVEWIAGSDADLADAPGTFRLVTMGRSFHWMDQEATLEGLHDLVEPGGGVAILADGDWLTRGVMDWQSAVYDLADEYLDGLPPRTGPITYDDPWDELLEEFGFTDVEVREFDGEREWDVEGVVGYVFSLSYCSPDAFGEEKEAFENDLRALLKDRDEVAFPQDLTVRAIAGRT